MAHPPPYPDSGDDATSYQNPRSGGRPRWVVAAGIAIAIGLLVLAIVFHLSGGIKPPTH